MSMRGFEGWYFKHQKDGQTVAFIPGRARGGAFVQMIDNSGSRQFDVETFCVKGNIIRAGACVFSPKGAKISLPGVEGTLRYGPLTPLASDIMGPFRFLPMECVHGVISMAHPLTGSLTVDGQPRSFDGGVGYIETDRGTSFPRSYLWLQCADLPQACSVMLSIAHIPFAGTQFTGCICAIVCRDREYRLATYRGVRIHAAGPEHIRLTQGGLLFEADITPGDGGYPLRSPKGGHMTKMIRESNQATLRCRLWDGGRPVLSLESRHAGFEYVP